MYEEEDRRRLASELADAFLDSSWQLDALAEAGAGRLDRWPSWMVALAMHVLAAHRARPVRSERFHLEATLDAFLARLGGPDEPLQIIRQLAVDLDASATPPIPSRLVHAWPIARIEHAAALAEQLELSDGQLAWLADVRGLERHVAAERLRNYRYRMVPRSGGLPRLIEIPKARLKEIQRWILHSILDHVPAHSAAHGFTPGRSCLTHAEHHVGRRVVLSLDLRDFFASVSAGRVFGIFATLGYAPAVARVLTGLTTNVVPLSVWAAVPPAQYARLVSSRFWLGRVLATPHLPQGAPTSPALANLACFRLDRRLAGLAAAHELAYTRYADDLTFSGPLSRGGERHVVARVGEIARAEGFAPNPTKTHAMGAGTRQSVCGIVVNARPNVSRRDYDRLKAALHQLTLAPPSAHDSEAVHAHLRGRIAWVASLNPARGAKLLEQFFRIDWESGAAGSEPSA